MPENLQNTRSMKNALLVLLLWGLKLSGIEAWSLRKLISRTSKIETKNTSKDFPVVIASSDEVAKALGVRPGSHAPRYVWKYSWRIHGYLLPLLHYFDTASARDFDYSLKCLWAKAISGRDKSSPVYDDNITYDMLPRGTRWLVKIPSRLWPRLIHFNIELRTAYLDNSLRKEIAAHSDKKIRLVTLGAGYDTRSVRFLSDGSIDEAWELDITKVLDSKVVMLERLKSRRHTAKLPILVSVDLNDVETFENLRLPGIVTEDKDWHTIFLLEGVLIYLKEGVPDKLLSACASSLKENDVGGSLVFADLLRGIPDGDFQIAKERLELDGWKLSEDDWCVKPGLARHMGTAQLRTKHLGTAELSP